MSALLELIKEAPPEDREAAAKLLKPYLDIKLPPEPEPTWIGMKEFRSLLPVPKSPTWLRTYLFPRVDWVVNPTPGPGGITKIDKQAAIDWLTWHGSEIDWSKPLPKG